jgi:hypothetical protein
VWKAERLVDERDNESAVRLVVLMAALIVVGLVGRDHGGRFRCWWQGVRRHRLGVWGGVGGSDGKCSVHLVVP